METLKLSLENTNGVVTILEGQAPKQAEQSSVKINGNIQSVLSYLKRRKLDKDNSHIEADKQNGTIVLFEKNMKKAPLKRSKEAVFSLYTS